MCFVAFKAVWVVILVYFCCCSNSGFLSCCRTQILCTFVFMKKINQAHGFWRLMRMKQRKQQLWKPFKVWIACVSWPLDRYLWDICKSTCQMWHRDLVVMIVIDCCLSGHQWVCWVPVCPVTMDKAVTSQITTTSGPKNVRSCECWDHTKGKLNRQIVSEGDKMSCFIPRRPAHKVDKRVTAAIRSQRGRGDASSQQDSKYELSR